jgi:hypothetical protein
VIVDFSVLFVYVIVEDPFYYLLLNITSVSRGFDKDKAVGVMHLVHAFLFRIPQGI